MEKLGLPQTHLSLKAMIQHVDEDHNGKISFREVIKSNEFLYCSQEFLVLVFVDFSESCFGK